MDSADEFVAKVAALFITKGNPYTLDGLMAHITELKVSNEILRGYIADVEPILVGGSELEGKLLEELDEEAGKQITQMRLC